MAGLRNDASITEGQELISSLLEHNDNPRVAFRGRFEHLFKDEDLLMATVLHPHCKLGVVGYLSGESLKELVSEVTNIVGEDRRRL